MSILGVFGIDPNIIKVQKATQMKNDSSIGQFSKIKRICFIFYRGTGIFCGVGNTGHTYIPSMLEHSGLSVNMATTVVAICNL